MTASVPSDSPAFITCAYGSRYAAFLAPHLHSIGEHMPHSRGSVFYQDIPAREICWLRLAFPALDFRPWTLDTGERPEIRIPRKLHLWSAANAEYPSSPVVSIDCDTLVVRDFSEFLTGEWDVAYTWKPETFPLNTGVMFARNGEVGSDFFRRLAADCEEIVEDPDRLRQASEHSGAADQQALRNLLATDRYDDLVVREFGDRSFRLRGYPCHQLNCTNCGPINDDVHIIHYKAGWHPILLDGAEFSVNRPADQCGEMHRHWTRVNSTANSEGARRIVLNACQSRLETFRPHATDYEERGILHSEMLAVCAVSEEFDVDLIIESGRCRGQSTAILGGYFRDSATRIASIELVRDDDAVFAEQRLAACENVELVYGDSHKLLPDILKQNRDRSVAVLLDGPKGIEAYELIQDVFSQFENVRVAFIHDMRLDTPQRDHVTEHHDRAFFTDDAGYVERFSALDETCQPADDSRITMHSWRPYRKGNDTIPSYGPTLAVLFPQTRSQTARPTPAHALKDKLRSCLRAVAGVLPWK